MGKLIIFSAPSGSGKTTIVKAVLNRMPGLEFSVSATSRQARENEIHGTDYYFFSKDDFKQRIDNHEFIEWEEVYEGQYYGTLKSEIERIWNNDHHVIFDVDVMGALNIKNQFPHNSLAIFIKPPSIQVLKERLKNRGTESPQQIEKRINKAEYELSFADKFAVIIVNDILEEAIVKAIQKINNFLLK